MQYEFRTTAGRSRNMRRIKGRNTEPERYLRKLLWENGIRYRKNSTKIVGTPDIAVTKCKVAIFVDGEFWHGFNWDTKKRRIRANRIYWIEKIERNIERDKRVNQLLTDSGWTVLRFWQKELKREPLQCLEKIVSHLKHQSTKAL